MSTTSQHDTGKTFDHPSIQLALARLCGEKVGKEEVVEEEVDEKHNSIQTEPPQQVDVKDGAESTLQSLSPNEQQQPPHTSRFLQQRDRHSSYRPVSLLVKRSDRTQNEDEEDQATFDDCFFDLLFSVSLSVYGTGSSLTTFDEVGQFISFFSLLWWSWWSQTLYDVRYRSQHNSSLFSSFAHRSIRIFLLGVWVAFSTCASAFSRGTYTNFTTVYALTRASLLADYLVSTLDPPPPREMLSVKVMKSRFLCHFINLAATTFSLLCWCTSRFLTSNVIDSTMIPIVYTLWILSVVVEMTAQMYVNLYGPFSCLSTTHLVERLALFSLIIIGTGAENIGLALDAISPREARSSSLSGGYHFATVLNAVSAVSILMLLFFGYFNKAVTKLPGSPILVLGWSYLHVALHLASAVIVVGLSKVISFSNTSEALREFDMHPLRHLPNSTDWVQYVASHFPTLVDFDSFPSVYNITDPFDLRVAAIQLTILNTQGATIPTVDQAYSLIRSTTAFQSMQWPSALQSQLQNYYTLVQSVESPQSAMEDARSNLFQFYWIFVCAALYMLADICLKALQGKGDVPSCKQANSQSLIVRSVFVVLLILAQVAYIQLDNKLPNSGLVTYVLPVLASVLSVEALIQSGLHHARHWKGKVVTVAREKHDCAVRTRNVPRR